MKKKKDTTRKKAEERREKKDEKDRKKEPPITYALSPVLGMANYYCTNSPDKRERGGGGHMHTCTNNILLLAGCVPSSKGRPIVSAAPSSSSYLPTAAIFVPSSFFQNRHHGYKFGVFSFELFSGFSLTLFFPPASLPLFLFISKYSREEET